MGISGVNSRKVANNPVPSNLKSVSYNFNNIDYNKINKATVGQIGEYEIPDYGVIENESENLNNNAESTEVSESPTIEVTSSQSTQPVSGSSEGIINESNIGSVQNSSPSQSVVYKYNTNWHLKGKSSEEVKVSSNQSNTKPNMRSETTNFKGIIKKRIAEIDMEIDDLKTKLHLRHAGNIITFNAGFFDTEELSARIQELELEKSGLKALISGLETEEKLKPFNDFMGTVEFKRYKEQYNFNSDNIDYGELSEVGYNITQYIYEMAKKKNIRIADIQVDELSVVEYIIEHSQGEWDIYYLATFYPDLTDFFDVYMYTSEEERMMYHYIASKDGIDAANKYLELLSDRIARAKGADMAAQFLSKLDLSKIVNFKRILEENLGQFGIHPSEKTAISEEMKLLLADFFNVSVKGLSDGIDSFFEGLNNLLITDASLSAEDYSRIIILEYLAENSNFYDEIYEFNSSLGNMIPAMAASALVSYFATPAAGAKFASVLMGLSAAGNAKKQALLSGNGLLSSTLYGFFVGCSEASLEYFLGNIPGISKLAGFTLKDIISEGVEEYLQEWIDAGLRSVILGENIDLTSVSDEALKSFLMGALMSGFLNGGQSIVNLTINGISVELDVQDTLEFISQNPDVDFEEAMELLNPELAYGLGEIEVLGQKPTITPKEVKKKLKSLLSANGSKLSVALPQLLLSDFNNTRNLANQKLICEMAIRYLRMPGISRLEAARMVGNIVSKTIDSRGYDSYTDFDTGISVHIIRVFDGSVQMYSPNEVIDYIKSLPHELSSLVKNIAFYDVSCPQDLYWEKNYKIKGFSALCTGGGGTINFWAAKGYKEYTIIIHEIGHTFDTAYAKAWGVETDAISESKLWKDAMAADKKINGLNGVTEYARSSNSATEDFADSIKLFYYDPEQFRNQYPNRYNVLNDHIKRYKTRATVPQQTAGSTQNSQTAGSTQNSQTSGSTQNSQTAGSTQNSQTSGSTQNSQTSGSTQNSQ